jgi:hypothetical protein
MMKTVSLDDFNEESRGYIEAAGLTTLDAKNFLGSRMLELRSMGSFTNDVDPSIPG